MYVQPVHLHILWHTLTRPVNVKWQFTLVLLYTKLAAFSSGSRQNFCLSAPFAMSHPYTHTHTHMYCYKWRIYSHPQSRVCMLDLFARLAALSHSAYQFSRSSTSPLRTFQGRKSILLMKTKENFKEKATQGIGCRLERKFDICYGRNNGHSAR